MPLGDIKPLNLRLEWTRLLECGGHRRGSKEPRPLSAKTVRNVAGVVSSAFAWAQTEGLVSANPVFSSQPPVLKKKRGIALAPAQQSVLLRAATNPWCLAAFLEVCAGTGAQRGEVLALRWSDVNEGRVTVTRSLSQA